MTMSVGILGTGWVGSSVAISVLQSGFATDLLLADVRAELAEGEAMDLAHGAAFYPSASVRSVPREGLLDTDAIVIAAGHNGTPSQSRLELLQGNVTILRDIGAALRGYRGIVVIVTNPVDVLTQIVQESSGLPADRVIGTGTMLDTARLRQTIGEEIGVDPRSVHAQVVGEHGDSEVVLWSGASVGGVPLRDWPGWRRDREPVIASTVRRAGYEIIKRKGATNHAIGLVTASLLRTLLRGERRVGTVSKVQSGALGFSGVALSLPTILDASGAGDVLALPLAPEELVALEASANVLRAARASVS
jgi:L-lactate dehydrogenase